MVRSRVGVVAVSCAVAAFSFSACGDDDTSSPADTGRGTTSSAAKPAAAGPSQASIDAALAFTGGKAGKADPSLPPVTVGYVNQEGGVPSFTEYHGTTSEAVNFVNNNLGGIDGHPLKLQECIIQSEEDGQKCGGELRDAKVPIGILGLAVVGNGSFYKAVDGTFPVLVDVSATGPDATSKMVYALDGGGASVLNAEAQAVKGTGATKVALLTADNPAGKETALGIQAPRMKELGVTPKIVLFADAATTPDFVTALSNSDAKGSGAIAFNPSAPAQCNQLADGLKQLALETPVVTNVFCAADDVVETTGDGLEGWVFSSFGWNPRVAGDPQGDAFADVMKAAGKSKLTNSGYTFKAFADLLAVAKFGNDVGFDNISGETLNKAILDWRGPAWMVPGEMKCGQNKVTIGVCSDTGRNSTFKDGKWADLGEVKLETAP